MSQLRVVQHFENLYKPHLRKCFENIARITFGDDLSMSEMTSAEGETVKFSEILYPRGNVENWLTDVERVMMASVREFLKISIAAYPDMERTDWVLKWPGQVVIAGCQTYWAQEVEEAITSNNMVEYCEKAGIHRPGVPDSQRPPGRFNLQEIQKYFGWYVDPC